MRVLPVVAISALLVACHSPVEVSGLYVAYDDTGALVRCDNPDTILIARDSALAATYRVVATHPYERMFVRLSGVRADSGSIYGGGRPPPRPPARARAARGAGEGPPPPRGGPRRCRARPPLSHAEPPPGATSEPHDP